MSMTKEILLVGVGSGIGGICRYLVSLCTSHAHNGFPWGTFVVNVAGCLLIGILWGVTSRYQTLSSTISLLFATGFCGGFTTFSTFSKESVLLLQSNNYTLFSLYVAGSILLGVSAVALGYTMTK